MVRGLRRAARTAVLAALACAAAWTAGLATLFVGTRLAHGGWPRAAVHWPDEPRPELPPEGSALGLLELALHLGFLPVLALALAACVLGARLPRTRGTVALGTCLAAFVALALAVASGVASS